MADVTETGITFDCPLCGVDIPLPHTDTADPNGLTVALDTEVYMEHAIMHADCLCEWVKTGEGAKAVIARVNPDCRFHAA